MEGVNVLPDLPACAGAQSRRTSKGTASPHSSMKPMSRVAVQFSRNTPVGGVGVRGVPTNHRRMLPQRLIQLERPFPRLWPYLLATEATAGTMDAIVAWL